MSASSKTSLVNRIIVTFLILLFAAVAGHFAVAAFKGSQLRKIAEDSALAAARGLTLFSADAAEVQNARQISAKCIVEGPFVKSIALPDGDFRVEMVQIEQLTGVRVTVSEQWSSFYDRVFAVPKRVIRATASARLLGSGKVEILQSKLLPLSDKQVGVAATKLSARCSA